jgi:hypothetical protein
MREREEWKSWQRNLRNSRLSSCCLSAVQSQCQLRVITAYNTETHSSVLQGIPQGSPRFDVLSLHGSEHYQLRHTKGNIRSALLLQKP